MSEPTLRARAPQLNFDWGISGAEYQSPPRASVTSRFRLRYQHFAFLAALSDVVAIIGASIVTGAAYHAAVFGRVGNVEQFAGVGAILAFLTSSLMNVRGLYNPNILLSLRSQLSSIVLIWGSVVFFLFGIGFTLKISDELSRGSILLLAVGAPFLIVAQRCLLKRLMVAILQKGWLKRLKIIVIAQDASSASASDETELAYEVVSRHALPSDSQSLRETIVNVVNAAHGSSLISEIHVTAEWDRWSDIKQLAAELRVLPIPIRFIAEGMAREILKHPHHRTGELISFELQRAPLSAAERVAKRAFDLTAASLGLVATAPLFLVVAVLVWLERSGPVLFRQTRGGVNGRAFRILKFRTMRVMEDGPTIVQASRHDDRVTRLGRWLRRSSVDELPQLINVVRGDMSLVGPRPHALAHDLQYSALLSIYPYRHHVKPGITGWAQVNGFRGETPSLDQMKQRVELDLWYVTNWSFWLDLRILFWTVVEVCRRRNAL